MDYEISMLFPEGKRKALTFSYDDGTIHDRRLAALLNEYGMNGTFNLNYVLLGKGGMETVNGIETDFSSLHPVRIHDPVVCALWHISSRDGRELL